MPESSKELFTLEITLGNAAMKSREDLASALRKVAGELCDGSDSGRIRDVNGNTVGTYGHGPNNWDEEDSDE